MDTIVEMCGGHVSTISAVVPIQLIFFVVGCHQWIRRAALRLPSESIGEIPTKKNIICIGPRRDSVDVIWHLMVFGHVYFLCPSVNPYLTLSPLV